MRGEPQPQELMEIINQEWQEGNGVKEWEWGQGMGMGTGNGNALFPPSIQSSKPMSIPIPILHSTKHKTSIHVQGKLTL